MYLLAAEIANMLGIQQSDNVNDHLNISTSKLKINY